MPEARTALEALHRGGIPEAVYGLHDLLCRTDLPAAADHDDAMQVFYQSELFDRQSPAVRQRITDELEQHIQLADDSEMPDVRTVLEAALPDSVREWLRLVRQQHLGPELGALLEEIREQAVTDEVIEQRLNAFKQRIGLEALLPSCCCCGIRDDYILEENLEFIRRRAGLREAGRASASARGAARSVPASSRDLFTEHGPPKSSYVKVLLQDPVLKKLRLSKEAEASLLADRAAHAHLCVFEDASPGMSSAFYHLHPGLVDTSSVPGETTVILCRACHSSLKKWKVPEGSSMSDDDRRKKAPTFSIMAGYDYGNIKDMPRLLGYLSWRRHS
jgi:hypothetical protein